MTTDHRTRYVLIPADPNSDEIHDVRHYATAPAAAGAYYGALHDDQPPADGGLPAARDGDLLYTQLVLNGETITTSWHIAGDDYLLPVTDDQLLEYLGEKLTSAVEQYLHAELGPGASR